MCHHGDWSHQRSRCRCYGARSTPATHYQDSCGRQTHDGEKNNAENRVNLDGWFWNWKFHSDIFCLNTSRLSYTQRMQRCLSDKEFKPLRRVSIRLFFMLEICCPSCLKTRDAGGGVTNMSHPNYTVHFQQRSSDRPLNPWSSGLGMSFKISWWNCKKGRISKKGQRNRNRNPGCELLHRAALVKYHYVYSCFR